MPLDISGFVTPEQKFEGLYKAGETLQKERARYATQANKGLSSLQKTLNDLVDPSKLYTLTPADQIINQQVLDVTKKGYDFIANNPTAQPYQLSSYLANDLSNLAKISNVGKTYNDMLSKSVSALPDGYDKQGLLNESKKNFFFDPSGKLRTADEMEQTLQTAGYDPIGGAIKSNPSVVIGKFDDWIKNQQKVKNTYSTEKGKKGKGGVIEKMDVELEHPWYMMPETDATGTKFVTDKKGFGKYIPKYEVATDANELIKLNGNDVRLVPDAVYNSVYQEPSNKSLYETKVDARLKEYTDATGKALDPTDPYYNQKRENIAKAILYEELAARPSGAFKISESEVRTPSTSVNVNVSAGGDKGAATAYDAYKQVSDLFAKGGYNMKRIGGKEVGALMTNFGGKVQGGLVSMLKDSFGDKYDASNTVVKQTSPGNFEIWYAGDDSQAPFSLLPISQADLDLAAGQIGAPEKRSVIQKGKDAVNKIVSKITGKKGSLNKKQ